MERLETILASGKHLPLTNSVIVDQAQALEYIDQLRVAIPEEIKSAKRINSEGERLIEQARGEAEEILARAQEQAAYLIEERELTRAAQEQSRDIVRQAQADADEIRRGADDYAAEILVALEGEMMRYLKSIKRGLELLDERRAADEAPPQEEPAEQELDEYDETANRKQPVRG